MNKINLKKANVQDAELLHELQIEAFEPLLAKYQDFETNPAAEPLEKTIERLNQDNTDFYLIVLDEKPIGAVRVVRLEDDCCKIGPINILPTFQNKGYARQAMSLVETHYPKAQKWVLATIEQEEKLCAFYTKMGYELTGSRTELSDEMTIVGFEKMMNKS